MYRYVYTAEQDDNALFALVNVLRNSPLKVQVKNL